MVKINLLASYNKTQLWCKYQQWLVLILILALLLLSSSVYWFLFKPQKQLLLLAQTQAAELQQQVANLLQQVNSPPMPENTPAAHTPSGYVSLQQPNVEVRSILQQIAASAGINLLLHESVQGNISVAFNNLPWKQALQVVLDLVELVSEQKNEVLIIRSAEEQIQKAQVQLKNQQQHNELIPVETVLIPVQYSQAQTLADLLISNEQEWLSARGAVSVDERTNTLLVRDIPDNLPAIQKMIQRLDIPVRQVAIEARILNVEESFSKELGILWGISGSANIGEFSNDILLNLEIQAAENENLVEELAHPRLITADQQTAIIRQGEEIPYQQSAEYGASTISFKPAVLELQVTPHITPDNHVIMKLVVKNDSRSAQALAENVPVITTKEIRTQVLVNNGETIVLGGIYTQGKNQQIEKFPVLGDIPGINRLFTSEANENERKELLVFVTPRIIE